MIFKQIDEILSGQKTQTRRVVKPNEEPNCWRLGGEDDETINEVLLRTKPTSTGYTARLKWVLHGRYAIVPRRGGSTLYYRLNADGAFVTQESIVYEDGTRVDRREALLKSGYRPLHIQIKQIRCEPLHDITECDAVAEGVASVEESWHNTLLVEAQRGDWHLENLTHTKLEHQLLLDAIRQLSDVGDLYDGADHLNEHTHAENEKLLNAALDKIYRIASGARFSFIGGLVVMDEE